jgi:ketosteroid isomerase-like protein
VPDDVDVVRRYLDALKRGDRAAARQLAAAELVLDLSGSDIPEPGVYEGAEEVERFVASWNEVWETYYQDVEHLIPVEEGRVVSLAREHGYSRSGVEVHGQEIAAAYTVSDGKIVRVREYPTWRAALAAFGLDEVP